MSRLIAGACAALLLPVTAGAQLSSFGTGTFLVGVDVPPGLYRSNPTDLPCYWERLSGLGGTLDDVIANAAVPDGPTIVEISASDYAFRSSGCAEWQRVERARSTVRYRPPVRPAPTRPPSAQPPASAGGAVPLTEEDRKLREAMMRTAALNAAGDWVEGLGLKRDPVWSRDYTTGVSEGFLVVGLSGGMVRSWRRLDCDRRRVALEDLFQFWERASASIWKDGVARTPATGVGVAEAGTRNPRRLGVLQVSGDVRALTDLAGCE